MYLLLPFILIPLCEIAVFIQVGGLIGPWPTVALVLLTTAAGMILLRSQGLATLNRVRSSLERHELPMAEVFDGMCLLLAGGLLLIPGFVTDTLGLGLFIPAVRRMLRTWLTRTLNRRAEMHVFVNGRDVGPEASADPRSHPHGPSIIDGEFREVPDSSGDLPPPDSRWGRPDSRLRY